MALNSKTFLTRTVSAAVFVVLLLGCVWFHPISFIAFFSVVGFIGLYEFYKLANKVDKKPVGFLGYILHTLSMATVFFLKESDLEEGKSFLILLVLAGPLYMLVELFKTKNSVFNFPTVVLSFLYVTVPCVLLILFSGAYKEYTIAEGSFHPEKVLGMIFFIWINDTGAYLAGSFFGKHKMYERVSPGKTWEGTIGGVLLCVGFSFLMVKIFPQLTLPHWIAVSIIVAVFGTLGDLVESMLKRIAGVKDSGNIMPGHGGVLDRFDSLLFATPFVFAYLAATGNL
ncbi:MAG TPA: phosphatidate cytidylyltransferase [Bacteroidia bacterium]|nr:phosphatidate cytidylyltransferase [Bacteroidia bacterium]